MLNINNMFNINNIVKIVGRFINKINFLLFSFHAQLQNTLSIHQ